MSGHPSRGAVVADLLGAHLDLPDLAEPGARADFWAGHRLG